MTKLNSNTLKSGQKKNVFALMLLMSLSAVSCGGSGGGGAGKSPAPQSAAAQSSPSGATTLQESTETVSDTDDSVYGTVGTDQNNSLQTAATSISSTSTLPAFALSFKANVNLMNFSAAQTTKYNKAVAMVKKVVGTEAFRSRVLNYTYAGARQFADNKGRTNAQIYQSILDAAESLKPIKNNTMDLGVKLYYEASNIVGFTNGSISYINVNTKYFNTFAVNEVAGNLFHEWLHKLGYTHDFSATAKRPYSVPYAVGYIVRDLGKSFL